ncbi:MAG: hypothetical protein GXP37_09880 [Chloroflexi bacterium]|nr:hypothetical protein [Chloroflexota bacterium]
MNFNLTDEQSFIQATIRKFMRRECPRPLAHELDEQGAFPGDPRQKLARLGFCSLTVPEAYGGGGPDLVAAAIVVEEIARLAPVLAGAFASTALYGGEAITLLGSAEQKQRLLPAVAADELSFSLALNEPAGDMPTTVIAQGDGYVLQGRKAFVSLADSADYLLVLAQSDANGAQSLFLVPAQASGIRRQAVEMVGYHGMGLFTVEFDQVHVSADKLLGGAEAWHQGKNQARILGTIEHVAQTAMALGIAQGAYEYTLGYAQERRQFGHALADFEAIRHMLVDLAIEIQAVRLMLTQACWQADQGRPFALEAAMARLRAGKLARQAGLQAVHILGGYGYTTEYDAQRALRDALVLFSGSETPALLKNSIGDLLALSSNGGC